MTRHAPPETAATPTPVIVLNWNGWEDTFACLRSLRDAPDVTHPWLVDNGSTVDRSDEALAIWPALRIIRLPVNYGFAGGMNRALQAAAAEGYAFAYVLNNDCTVMPGFLRGALAAARQPDVAVVGSRIASADLAGVIFDGAYHASGAQHLDPPFCDRRVPAVNGAGMLVRIAALERHGYFDERYFCYHEEVELCSRLAAFGWSSVVAGDSLIVHKRGASDRDGNALYYRVRNRFLLLDHLHGWRRLRRTAVALHAAAVRGREARHLGHSDAWRVLASAVDDGIRGRFGRRLESEATGWASLQFAVLCALLPPIDGLLRTRAWMRRLHRANGRVGCHPATGAGDRRSPSFDSLGIRRG